MTAKKFTKKRDARAKIVVLLIKPIAFVMFPLPSPLSDLKVPITSATGRIGAHTAPTLMAQNLFDM